MSENLRNYVKSVYAFEHVLRLAKDKAFTAKSPCAGWTGKDVFEHALGNLKMIESYATTGNGPKSIAKLGKDPLAQWARQRDLTLAALDQAGALQTIANNPFGPEMGSFPVDVLVGFMAADLAPHVWDMARTAKVDERLDPALVKYTVNMWKGLPEEVLRMSGMMTKAVKPAPGADAQTKMLNFLGRTV